VIQHAPSGGFEAVGARIVSETNDVRLYSAHVAFSWFH
jgi:hypothetical protein